MSIGISIGGTPGMISAAAVRDSLDDLLTLLAEASETSGVGRQQWNISDLHVGSAVIVVSSDEEAPVTEILMDGLDLLSRSAEMPRRWTRKMLVRIARLGERAGHGGATSIELISGKLSAVSLAGDVALNARRALGEATTSYGSVRGRVQRWNEQDRKRRQIGVTLDDGTSIPVYYAPNLAEKVITAAISHRIEAWGLTSRSASGEAISLTMDDFELLPEREAVPIGKLVGVFGNEDGTPWFSLSDWMAERGD